MQEVSSSRGGSTYGDAAAEDPDRAPAAYRGRLAAGSDNLSVRRLRQFGWEVVLLGAESQRCGLRWVADLGERGLCPGHTDDSQQDCE